MKVKSESEVAQSCLTLSDPMGVLPGSSVRGIFQAMDMSLRKLRELVIDRKAWCSAIMGSQSWARLSDRTELKAIKI